MPPFNYSPVPFAEMADKAFMPLKQIAGEYYEGQWSETNGLRSGFGYCVYEDGSLYEGYW